MSGTHMIRISFKRCLGRDNAKNNGMVAFLWERKNLC